ncbi:hypothetical protein Pan216_08570 [Planctomycetes bacterium Pan216]|uniref:Uncharacterized protein n=1 Tax=Kolteria novifilia TaxID=2527975 RepID=A0A518AZ81_9BACT|nr:hypothetical protein Pan216_08570 [Planctomycetes bacterium Pan216]
MPQADPLYPQEIPLDAVREIVRVIRQLRVGQERRLFAKECWITIGYLLGRVFGDPDQLSVVGSIAPSDEEQMCRLLEVTALPEARVSQPAEALPLPARLLLRWLLRRLLDELLQEEIDAP